MHIVCIGGIQFPVSSCEIALDVQEGHWLRKGDQTISGTHTFVSLHLFFFFFFVIDDGSFIYYGLFYVTISPADGVRLDYKQTNKG